MEMKEARRSKTDYAFILLCVVILLIGVSPATVFAANRAVSFEETFKPSVLPEGTDIDEAANGWQICKGKYPGPYPGGMDVSEIFDKEANVSYSADDLVRMQKNVIGSDIENEFTMYLNIEPQVSWKDIMQLNTIRVTNANKPVSPPEWPTAGNITSQSSPVQTPEYKVPVEVQYFAMKDGKRIDLALVTMWFDISPTPNGSIGIGNPLLSGTGTFFAKNGVDFTTGTAVQIDVSGLYDKFEFNMNPISVKSVTDVMGDNIEIYRENPNYDGGSCSIDENTLTWELPDKDLDLLSYTIGEDGSVTPSGVLRKLESGRYTYYRQEAYRLSYRFALDVHQGDGFVSCGSADSPNDINACYAVQTNKSPDAEDNKTYGGQLEYTVGDTMYTGHFESPYIKGLLYDIEFRKVLAGSNIPLKGITFEAERTDLSDSTYSENVSESRNASSKKDGSVILEDLPWGRYEIKEISINNDDRFQTNYLDLTGNNALPKKINAQDAVSGEKASVGYVLQPDKLKDGNKYILGDGGAVENEAYRAKIKIIKYIENADEATEEIQQSKYCMELKSRWDAEADTAYEYPGKTDTALKALNGSVRLGNGQAREYELLLPEKGAAIDLTEMIPEDLRSHISFKDVRTEKNTGSTDHGGITARDNGSTIKVLPGNDLTVIVTNTPVGRLYITKIIENYDGSLEDDEFIINAVSSGPAGEAGKDKMEVSAVLKNGETSGAVVVNERTIFKITETVPKEYQLVKVIKKTDNGKVLCPGGTIEVKPGEDAEAVVYNRYEWRPYFHSIDTIMNLMKTDTCR